MVSLYLAINTRYLSLRRWGLLQKCSLSYTHSKGYRNLSLVHSEMVKYFGLASDCLAICGVAKNSLAKM